MIKSGRTGKRLFPVRTLAKVRGGLSGVWVAMTTKKQILLNIFFIVFVLITTWGNAQFKHPGHLSSLTELTLIRTKIKNSQEPWLTGFNKMKLSAPAKRDYLATPTKLIHIGTNNINPRIGYDEINNDSKACYIQALMWFITQDTQYAKNVINICKSWGETLQEINPERNGPLVVAWYATLFCRGAEIVKYTYKGWNAGVDTPFVRMLDEEFFPLIKSGSANHNPLNPDWANSPVWDRHAGNWSTSKIESLLAMAIFKNDKNEFNRAIALAKERIEQYITAYGKMQEICRDIGHMQFTLGGLINIAEMARNQGVDLYAYLDNRMMKGMEYSATIINGEIPSPPPGCTALNDIKFHPAGWEIGYNHYHHRKGLSLPQAIKLLARHRPDGISRYWGWGSLTHQQLSQ